MNGGRPRFDDGEPRCGAVDAPMVPALLPGSMGEVCLLEPKRFFALFGGDAYKRCVILPLSLLLITLENMMRKMLLLVLFSGVFF
jgi:hypothetical protein